MFLKTQNQRLLATLLKISHIYKRSVFTGEGQE